jgi:hypothetical protein
MRRIIALFCILAVSSVFAITGCTKKESSAEVSDKPSEKDIIHAVQLIRDLSRADVRPSIEVIKVKKIIAKQYGNPNPVDKHIPVRVFSLVLEKNYGEMYLYQEIHFYKVIPEYGKPRWDFMSEVGISGLKKDMTPEDFLRTPLGQGLE